MKVCMVVHQDYYADARVIRYAEALAAAGVAVDVLCLRDPLGQHHAPEERIRVIPIPLTRPAQGGSYVWEYARSVLLFSIWLLLLQLKRRYTIIHVHNMPDFLMAAAIMPRLLGARLILDIHDPMPEFYLSKYGLRGENRMVRLMRLQERWSAALAHLVITANDTFKANLVQRGIGADKVVVVNNVADSTIFDRRRYVGQERDGSRFTLIYPGTIAPRYGLEVALRSLPLLAPHIPHIRLLLLGPRNRHVEELEALAEELGVAPLVAFLPPVAVDQVPMQIARADIGIYPALPDPHMSIAVPSKVLEYALMGIPILASQLPALTQLFGADAVMYVAPGDVEQFAAGVLALYADPQRRAALVARCDQTFVRSHRWEQERQRYFAALRHLCGPRRASVLPDDSADLTSHSEQANKGSLLS